MKNIVFYSKQCQHSKKMIHVLSQMPFSKEFEYYSVDPDPASQKPNKELLYFLEVEKVPTVYVNGNKFVGSNAFLWLKSEIDKIQEAPTQKKAQQQQEQRQQEPPMPRNGAMRLPPDVTSRTAPPTDGAFNPGPNGGGGGDHAEVDFGGFDEQSSKNCGNFVGGKMVPEMGDSIDSSQMEKMLAKALMERKESSLSASDQRT